MKLIVVLFSLIFCRQELVAQSQQIQLYIQQIAANQAMIGYIRDGFRIAKFGLTTIGDLKNGEFHLHAYFFNTLKSVNPKIKEIAKVGEIISMQVEIAKEGRKVLQGFDGGNAFTPGEIRYIKSVVDRLLADVVNTLEELYTTITANQYQMSDDERIRRIEGLYAMMQKSMRFSKQFNSGVRVMAGNRREEAKGIEIMKKLLK